MFLKSVKLMKLMNPMQKYLHIIELFAYTRKMLAITRFAISARDPLLWNNCLSKEEKEIDNFLLFKKRAKEKIMELSTAANFFQ